MKEIKLDPLELARIKFVADRDGSDAALAFVKQTMAQYRRALSQRNELGYRCGYGLSYRKELVSSCVVFRVYIRKNK